MFLLSFPLVRAFSAGSSLALRLDLHLLRPLLTSDRASRHLSVPVALSGTAVRSPRVLHTHLHAYARRIYAMSFRASFGLWRFRPPHPSMAPRIRFLFVEPALCHPASFRLAVARETLAFG